MNKQKTGVFAGVGDMLAKGFDLSVTSEASDQMINLDLIEIRKQIREEFEDAAGEHSLAELGRDLRKEQLQSIIVRPNVKGAEKPFILVSGERRVRAAKLEGLTALRARVRSMTDEQADQAQLSENIHRKNLTQIEEARKIQADLDRLGSVEAVLALHNKGRAWLSKIMGLLSLPQQSKRLVAEDISCDLNVINAVRVIEAVNPEKAAELVSELKDTRGKVDARRVVDKVRAQVKPPKSPAKRLAHLLDDLVDAVRAGRSPAEMWANLSEEDQAAVSDFMKPEYVAAKTTDIPLAKLVMRGLADGRLGHDGRKGLRLSALLMGATEVEFDPVRILEALVP